MQLRYKLFLSTLTLLLGPGVYCYSQTTITLQPDAIAGQDTRIWSLEPNTPTPVVDDFIAAYWTWGGDPGILRSLIKFDLSGIPSTANIISAKLSLYYNPTSSSAGQTGNNACLLQRVTSSWEENTVTWNTQPSVTTSGEAQLAQSSSPNQDYPDINVKSMVTYMVNHPVKNHGFMLRLQNETSLFSSLKFASSDHSNSALHPKLVITYDTLPAPIDSTICIKLKPGPNNGIDSRIWSLEPSTPTPTVEDFIAAYWTWNGVPGILRSLVKFDLSSIPSDANITSAKLSLYYNPTSASAGQAGNNASWLQRVTSSWDESSVTWNTQPSTTTDNQASLAESISPTQDYLNIGVKKMVKYMFNHPNENYGFMLRLQDETALFSSMKFASSDHSNSAIHPKLKICYTSEVNGKQVNEEAELEPISLKAYPNPFTDHLTIDMYTLNSEWAIISVTSAEGYDMVPPIKLSKKDGSEEIDLNELVRDWPSGMYFIKLTTAERSISTKILKQE